MSASTVSRALNRPELVNPGVVARVRAAVDDLGYSPNPFARSLRVQGSRTLGLIVPDSTNPFFAEVAKGIQAACFRAGYTLILCNSDRSLEKEAAEARVLYEQRVDGVLLFNASDGSGATIAWLLARSLPVVLLERRSPGPAVDCVVSDNAGGVRLAIEHLAERGHRRVACLLGDRGTSHYAERLAAYERALGELGLEERRDLVRTELLTFADGQTAASELLRSANPPTALFCATDTLAIGAIRGAALAGKRVPHDVAIVGYGDTEIAAYTQPPLTSVVQEKLAVGGLAVRALLRRLAGRAANGNGPARPRAHVVATRAFEVYVERILAPTLQPGQIVAMDNLRQHHSERVRQMIEARGASRWFLPTYSPDLNPIEEAFSKVKSLLRTAAARIHETLVAAMWAALGAISPSDARGYFTHCGHRRPARRRPRSRKASLRSRRAA